VTVFERLIGFAGWAGACDQAEFVELPGGNAARLGKIFDRATLRRERVLGKDGGFAAGLDGFVGVFGIDFQAVVPRRWWETLPTRAMASFLP